MYASKVSEKVQPNYEYVSSTNNTSGIMTEDTIEVIYYYKKQQAGIEQTIDKIGTEKITNEDEKVNYTITYTGKVTNYIGKATVTLTPDENTYVLGNSGEKYVLSSIVRVYEDGTEEEITKDENGIYKYEIEAGKKYTFMAKYETIILVYHLNSSEVKTEIRKSGEKIGTMPRPTYDVEDLNKNYIFVGWSKDKPSTGYHKLSSYEETENINMQIATSIINESIELWPVYVKVGINVNSNIDEDLQNSGITLNSIRYITRPDINRTQINAKYVNGYDFEGWYKNYTDNENRGELVSKDKTYILQKQESLEKETYTAVYVKAYRINYYNTKGEIIYSVGVKQDENRTFVNETLDNQGNKVETPIDYMAYQNIMNGLSLNETFKNWEWKKSDGSIVSWEDFYDVKIEQNMDLYPIVRKITVKDSENQYLLF